MFTGVPTAGTCEPMTVTVTVFPLSVILEIVNEAVDAPTPGG